MKNDNITKKMTASNGLFTVLLTYKDVKANYFPLVFWELSFFQVKFKSKHSLQKQSHSFQN